MRPRRLLTPLLLGGATLAAAPAGAEPTYGRGIDAQLQRPALDSRGLFGLESARSIGKHQFALRLGADFASEPFALDTVGGGEADAIMDYTLAFSFGFAFGLSDKLTLGLDTPILLQPLGAGFGVDGVYVPGDPNADGAAPGTGFYSSRDESNILPAENTVGDVRLGLKYRLGASLALQVVGWVPFGDEDVFAGSSSATVEPKVIYEMAAGKKGRIVGNASVRLREGTIAETRALQANGTVMNDADGNPIYLPKLFLGSEVVVGAGAMFDLTPKLALGGELSVFVPIVKAADAECPDPCKNGDLTAQALIGARVTATPDVAFQIGGGLGLIGDAARSPGFRVLAGLVWAPSSEARLAARGDADGDGIPDGPDVCPDEPEDNDGFQDDDGCPELDNDLDGVLDAQDKCKDEPEDRDDYDDGDGCPEGDNDKDNVPDLNDRCPGEAEDMDGFADDDGCPDEDNDGDGILDAKDRCPDEPETVNGYQDMDGCPDQAAVGGPKLVGTGIDLQGEKVDFTGKTDKLTRGAEATLDAVATIMRNNPTIRFRIEVGVEETSKRKRDKDADRALSERRAGAVRAYLMSKGVPAAQLDTAGLGSDRPIDRDPKNAKNRRVEFIRLNQ